MASSKALLHFKNAAPLWGRQLARLQPQRLVVLSPYITSRTAEQILEKAPVRAEIYTLFNAEIFASGSSSLKTLKLLLKKGHQLFALPGLHAKILWAPDHFLFVGSQNLTTGGTIRKEASVLITDEGLLGDVEQKLQVWLKERLPITSEIISAMQRELPKLKASHESFKKFIEFSNEKILPLLTPEHLTLKASLSKAISKAINSSDISDDYCEGRVQVVESNEGWSSTYSLVATARSDLTEWMIDDKPLTLSRTFRYLCVLPSSGKLGWARVMKTRITFVAPDITWTDSIAFGATTVQMTANADWSEEPEEGRNLYVELATLQGIQLCTVNIVFDLEKVLVLSLTSMTHSSSLLNATARGLTRWISRNKRVFIRTLLERLTKRFSYTSNLRGVQATQFFGPLDTRYKVYVARVSENPVVVVDVLSNGIFSE